jgi:hypothetical protein
MCSGPSAGEKTAAAQTAAMSQQLMTQFQQEFSESTELQSFLTAQLMPMITNPTGFTAQQTADLRSTLINSVDSQMASTTQQQQQAQAVSNEAGLPSGVASMNQAILQGEASSTESQGLLGIQEESAQLAQQRQQAAIGELAQVSGQATQAGTSLAGTAVNSNNSQFNQQETMQQQSTSMWSNILNGVLGAGLSFATGGLSNLTSGQSFFGSPAATPAPASNYVGPSSVPAGGGVVA